MVFGIDLVGRTETIDRDLKIRTGLQANFDGTLRGIHADHLGLDQLAAGICPNTHLRDCCALQQ